MSSGKLSQLITTHIGAVTLLYDPLALIHVPVVSLAVGVRSLVPSADSPGPFFSLAS